MKGINKVILLGTVGSKDTRHTASGNPVVNLSVATSESWVKDGNKEERTEWHKCVVFGKLAEIADKYVDKGMKIYIEGKLQTRSYETEGVKKYSTEILVNEFQMLSSKERNVEEERKQLDNFDQDEIPF